MIGPRSHVGRLRWTRSPAPRALCVLSVLVLALTLSACGSLAYSVNVVRAARSVEQAKQVGAVERAPYEMTLAQAYLEKAREESAEAAYQDAVRFARLSKRYADEAAEKSKKTGEKPR